ncbi:MAG TPA: hypothetical protein VKE49_07870 [Myxococcaceae bacterium]|nr:hypothetical protein [Myxococcaceae bacterium]
MRIAAAAGDLTIFAQLLVTSLAVAEQGASVPSRAASGWEPYPAYSNPPLVTSGTPQRDLPTIPSASADREPSRRWLGVTVDAGVPDVMAASVALRPWHWLRLQAGGMHNTVSPGLRGGISLVPFYFWITPSLTLEAGRYFEGDATWIARRLTPNRNLDPLFGKVGYDFGNAHLGLELGSPRSVSFFLRAGISYVQMGKGVQQAISDPTIQAGDVPLSGVIPSAKLGLLVYFL